MASHPRITEIEFKAWEPDRIIPDMKRGWPDPIRNVAATPISEPPRLDGTLASAAWKAVAVVEPQNPFFHDNPLVRTQVFLCWDNRHLYVGIRADLPKWARAIAMGCAEDEDRKRAERVTISLDRRHTHDEMVAISINALGELEWTDAGSQGAGFSNEVGYQTEEVILREMNPDPAGRAREMGIRGAARFGETEWTAEMAIPLKNLNAELPVSGLTMGLEVTRTATERPVEKFNYHFTWMEPYEGVLSSPVKMGVMSLMIEAVDGSVTFDLMQDGVMRKIADWLCGLYDNDVDRLIGSAFFMAQQAVYVYASRRAIFSVMINPLSNLRLGGGMCGEFARSHVGLLHQMKSAWTGKPFRARLLGVGGHSLTTVWMDDRWVLLDPTTCNIKAFFLRDHKTLASGQDLRNDPTLIAENGSSSLKFAKPLLVHDVVCGTNWPDGAPKQ